MSKVEVTEDTLVVLEDVVKTYEMGEVTVTALVSTVKMPLIVADPAPVTLLLVAASVTTNFKPPVLPRTSEPPLLTVVVPV